MEIILLMIGIISLFQENDIIFGLCAIGCVFLLWLIGFIWDKKQYNDWFYSWRQLNKLWGNGTLGGKGE